MIDQNSNCAKLPSIIVQNYQVQNVGFFCISSFLIIQEYVDLLQNGSDFLPHFLW